MATAQPMMKDWICPSILSADFSRLGEETQAVLDAGADMIHFDVMDNHYVPNLTFGPMVCKALRKYGIEAPIDVHLMVTPVERLIDEFIEAGASFVTFHPEASGDMERSLQRIRDSGCKSGLALNPQTPLDCLPQALEQMDMLLLMSVNPGFGGQSFIPATLEKLRQARKRIDESGHDIRLQIDGGVKCENIARIKAAGADTFVAGSAVFGAADYHRVLGDMRAALASV